MKIRKAVIPVAGLGTRFLPATKVVPKELLPIVDRPTIHYIVEEAHNAGIDQIIFITASQKGAIEDYFDHTLELEAVLEEKGDSQRLEMIRNIAEMVEVHSVRQKKALGLGHAVLMAKDFIGNEPFAVLLGDDLIDSKVPAIGQMIAATEQYPHPMLAVCRVPQDKVHRYGIIDPDPVAERLYKIRSMVEKPKTAAPSNLAIIGRYILTPDIFDILSRTKPTVGGEIQLTAALETLNSTKQEIWAFEFEGIRYDAGDIFGFLEANIMYALKHPEYSERLINLIRERIAVKS